MAIGINSDIADEIARGPRRAFDDLEGARGCELSILIE